MVGRLLADPTIGALGAKIYDPGWKTIQHAGGVLRDNALTDHVGRGEEDRGQHDETRDCPYVTGAALALRREVLEQVGLLDPWYVPAYFEEADLCARIRRHGLRIVYEPRARLVHHEGTASGKGSERFFYCYHRNRLRFVLRNYPFLSILERFVPAELAWMRRWLPPEQKGPLARAYATNLLRLPATLLGY
jgi:GT2 family glycosyltransferase